MDQEKSKDAKSKRDQPW